LNVYIGIDPGDKHYGFALCKVNQDNNVEDYHTINFHPVEAKRMIIQWTLMNSYWKSYAGNPVVIIEKPIGCHGPMFEAGRIAGIVEGSVYTAEIVFRKPNQRNKKLKEAKKYTKNPHEIDALAHVLSYLDELKGDTN
jgi:hypothetical protein